MSVLKLIPMEQSEDDCGFHSGGRMLERCLVIAMSKALSAEDRLDRVMTQLCGKDWRKDAIRLLGEE